MYVFFYFSSLLMYCAALDAKYIIYNVINFRRNVYVIEIYKGMDCKFRMQIPHSRHGYQNN